MTPEYPDLTGARMPYRYLDDIATADAAFEATGETLEVLFSASADALTGIMTAHPADIDPVETVTVECAADSPDMLLFRFLGELVYLKDARKLLLRAADIRITEENGGYFLSSVMRGEEIDSAKHRMIVDVKAITLHRLKVEEHDGVWTATVVADV